MIAPNVPRAEDHPASRLDPEPNVRYPDSYVKLNAKVDSQAPALDGRANYDGARRRIFSVLFPENFH